MKNEDESKDDLSFVINFKANPFSQLSPLNIYNAKKQCRFLTRIRLNLPSDSAKDFLRLVTFTMVDLTEKCPLVLKKITPSKLDNGKQIQSVILIRAFEIYIH